MSSKEYNDVYKGMIDVLDAYLDFYTFLNEEISTKGLDDTITQEERIHILSTSIANRNFKRELVVKNLADLSDNFELKREMLKRYIMANYSEAFTKTILIDFQ